MPAILLAAMRTSGDVERLLASVIVSVDRLQVCVGEALGRFDRTFMAVSSLTAKTTESPPAYRPRQVNSSECFVLEQGR